MLSPFDAHVETAHHLAMSASPEAVRAKTLTEAESSTRVELAACYRLVARFGMTDLIYNHISARIPGTSDHFLINPYGLFYQEITASSLVKIDIAGNVIEPGNTGLGINRAGYVIHSAIHGARHDVQCVIHTHTRSGVAVSAMPGGLLPISQTALRFVGRTGYHDYEGPAVDEDERVRLAAALGRNDALILRNHGLLTCGRSISEAFYLMQRLETACQIQVSVLSCGAPLLPSAESQKRTAAMFNPAVGRPDVAVSGELEWRALIRLLDREDTSYKR